jgi:hypothetical protein
VRAPRVRENPFYVLGVPPEASRAEIEQQGQKLLAMLELGLAGAGRYDTPLGAEPRTADDVRRALAELRDPERRLVHELWARLPPTPVAEAAPAPKRAAGWGEAMVALGWKKR